MKTFLTCLVVMGTALPLSAQYRVRRAAAAPVGAERTLSIYIADTEGGKAALFVAPSGETVLIDAGNPGGRDTDRIMEMLAAAGVTKIDYLISTHYHVDHVGGLPALAQRVPIAHYMDHGTNVEARGPMPGFDSVYAALYGKAKHTVLRAGDRVPIAGVDWRIVTSAGRAIASSLPGAGAANAACANFQRHANSASPDDNGQSVGSLITFGRFRALDLGDLLWNNEFDLMCPRNKIGTVDLYLVSHHGLAQSGSPALVNGIRPRVAIMQNGPRKGGAPSTFQTLYGASGLEDLWTLHWSYAGGIEYNVPGAFIANLDDPATIAGVVTAGNGAAAPREVPAHAPAHWIKVVAREDGSFTVTNTRNGFGKTYEKRYESLKP